MGIVGKIQRLQKEYGLRFAMDMVRYRYQIKFHLGKRYYPFQIPDAIRRQQQEWVPDRPVKISIVVPLYNTPEDFLCEMIESVMNQTYADWELCLADASDTLQPAIEEIVQEYIRKDARIRYRKLPENDGISNNTNHAIYMAQGEYIGLLDHDDLLHPSALYYVMKEINDCQADFVYTDELSFDRKTERVQSIHLKPDFSQESFRCNNYICHFSVFQKELLQQAGMFRKSFDGSQDYDLFLRLTDVAQRIRHVPEVLYYWRCHAASVASRVGAKPYTVEAGRRALEEHLKRQQIPAKVEASKEHPSFYRVHYAVPEQCRINILCEGQEAFGWVKSQTIGLPWQIRIADIRSRKTFTSGRWHPEEHGEKGDSSHAKPDGERGWLESDVTVLVREGYRPKQRQGAWLGELLQCLQPKENMVAAPIVLETDGRVYHAGYCYDIEFPEKIRSLYRGLPGTGTSYMNRLRFRQNVSLLGGAVLAVKTEVLQRYMEQKKLGELQAAGQQKMFSDTVWFSLCLTAKKMWGDCILTPYSVFEKQREATKEFPEQTAGQQEEWQRFFKQWERELELPDAHYNPGMGIFGSYYFLW